MFSNYLQLPTALALSLCVFCLGNIEAFWLFTVAMHDKLSIWNDDVLNLYHDI